MGDAARILVLEDDSGLRNVLKNVLEEEGYDVTAVERGEAAVEKATSEVFDLIIADIRMEGMDGLEAIERTQNLQPNIASLVVSGYASEKDTARAERLQVGGYLTKPFKMRDLLNYVREQLKNRQVPEEDSFMSQALDWTLTALARSFDEARTFEGSLLQASRTAEAICHHLKLPSRKCLAARWATILSGSSRLPGLTTPEFAIQPNQHYPELSALLQGLDPEETPEETPLEVTAVQLCLEKELDSESTDLGERYEIEVLDAHEAVQVELADQPELPLEVRLGLEKKNRKKSSLLVLAKTFERAGDETNAQKAFRSLWSSKDQPRWRLEGALGVSRLAALSGRSEDCRKAGLQALKVAKALGPSALATSGLEAALWLEYVDAPETGKAIELVSRAAGKAGQAVPQALLKFAGERLGGPEPQQQDIDSLVSLSATNDLSRYILWFLPHLVNRAESNGAGSGGLLERVIRDFPLEFLRLFDPSRSQAGQRVAVSQALSEARYLPDSVLQAMAEAPEAAVKEIAAQIRSRAEGESAQELVRVYSFGNLELISRGETLNEKSWKTRKVKFLFTMLASDWGRLFPTSVLIEAFWPDERTRKKENLYWAVTAMRKVLKSLAPSVKEPIPRMDDNLGLDPEYPRWHDMEEFERAAQATLDAYEKQEYESALNHCRVASRLYRGEYLDGCYYDFAVSKREALANSAFEACRRGAEAALSLGLNEQALEHASQAVELAPYRQEAHALKMRAYIRLHQAAEAIKQYQEIERILKLEYDVEPATELLELFHRARLGFTDA
jgi:two-component SAPR family response regulator